MQVLIAWKSVESEGFCQCHIWSKFEDTRHSYGFELMLAEIGVKTEGKIQYLCVILFLLADLIVDNVGENK